MLENNKIFSQKMQKCEEYIQALEAERRKIQVFERELPLCLELVTQAIEGCKQQMSATTTDYFNGQSECSEQTSSEGPVLEEFIPMKRTSSTDEDASISRKSMIFPNNDKLSKKSDWLRSVQLGIQSSDSPIKECSPRKVPVVEVKRNGCGAFHPFKKEKVVEVGEAVIGKPAISPVVPTATASSTAETGGSSGGGGGSSCGGCKNEDKEGNSQRKSRRCWSPELHRRFLQALQQLGGAHVGTPKQIRELMKVDGLTNDEVKSHLQKYRLHTRRPSHSIQNNNNPQTPQFVVVGGLWMPPPEYAAMATKATSGDVATTSAVYTPIPIQSVPNAKVSASETRTQHSKQVHSDDEDGHNEDETHSNSPATSSSTHTTTASPAF